MDIQESHEHRTAVPLWPVLRHGSRLGGFPTCPWSWVAVVVWCRGHFVVWNRELNQMELVVEDAAFTRTVTTPHVEDLMRP